MSNKPKQIGQIDVVIGIMGVIEKLRPKATVTQRQINTITKAATEITEAMNAPYIPAQDDMGLKNWLACDETGLSSRCMAYHICQAWTEDKLAYPLDAADFGRCLGFLRAVPDARKRLHLMGNVSPRWNSIISHWGTLEDLHTRKEWTEFQTLLDKLIR